MSHELFEWILLIGRWVHITVAVTWIGTSIFFMWMDRTLKENPSATKPGHIGDMWMLHGGGFYFVEKLLMGPTKVPKELHWFKWESYWTWMSGMFLLVMIFYTGGGTFLLDESVSSLNYMQGVCLSLFSIFGSWFIYDFLWEQPSMRKYPKYGHFLTLAYFVLITYILCHTLAGRAAFIHVGGMLGTWMAANVFMRIIPRQVKMVEAAKRGESVNPDWAINAKNRSTHNTYFTLPVIFIMLSNHFPMTYGHDLNWLVLILLAVVGAAIREYFVIRLSDPKKAYKMAAFGIAVLVVIVSITKEKEYDPSEHEVVHEHVESTVKPIETKTNSLKLENLNIEKSYADVSGTISISGDIPKGKKLRLPGACRKGHKGDVFSDEVKSQAGKLQGAIVHIKNANFAKEDIYQKSETIEVDQRGCIYRPRIAAAMTGTEVVFINSDPIVHNVKTKSKNNPSFNVTMPKKNQRIFKKFDNPEFVILAKCSLHPWMSGSLAVFDHPFFSVSNVDGEFGFKRLPTGKYTLEVWHETLGTQVSEIEVSADTKELNIEFNYQL